MFNSAALKKALLYNGEGFHFVSNCDYERLVACIVSFNLNALKYMCYIERAFNCNGTIDPVHCYILPRIRGQLQHVRSLF